MCLCVVVIVYVCVCARVYACERVKGVSFVVWVLSERVSAQGKGSPRGAKLSHGSTQPTGGADILPWGYVRVCVCVCVCVSEQLLLFPVCLKMLMWVNLPLCVSVYVCVFCFVPTYVFVLVSVWVVMCVSVCQSVCVVGCFCLRLSSAPVCAKNVLLTVFVLDCMTVRKLCIFVCVAQEIAKARFSPQVTLALRIALLLSVFMTASHALRSPPDTHTPPPSPSHAHALIIYVHKLFWIKYNPTHKHTHTHTPTHTHTHTHTPT